MVTITHNAIEEMANVISQLENLTSKPRLSAQEERQHATLLAKLSALKIGASVEEIRNFDRNRLLAQAGMRMAEPARTKLPREVETEWRNFVTGREVPKHCRPSEVEVRANQAGQETITWTQGAAGGYFVPQDFSNRAYWTMKQYDQIFDDVFSNIVETDTGSAMPFPQIDDTANQSVQVGEATQSSEVDVANFGSMTLNAWAFRSKIIGVSLELLQDSAFPWGTVLERIFAERHARGVGQALVTGTGVNSPTGLLTAVVASGATPVIANGSSGNTGGAETGSTSVGSADIARTYAALNAIYRPGARWYMNDNTLQYLMQLVDKSGRPLAITLPGWSLGDPDIVTIMGKRVAVCPSMPSMASGKNSIVFGNPLYFVQRRVPSSMYIRAFWQNPTLVQFGLVGFESWLRTDSNLASANANLTPYVYLQNHS